jgi:hypothetical protein
MEPSDDPKVSKINFELLDNCPSINSNRRLKKSKLYDKNGSKMDIDFDLLDNCPNINSDRHPNRFKLNGNGIDLDFLDNCNNINLARGSYTAAKAAKKAEKRSNAANFSTNIDFDYIDTSHILLHPRTNETDELQFDLNLTFAQKSRL